MIIAVSIALAGLQQPCLTDAEIEAVIGPQIRSGAGSIRVGGLRDAPLCSNKSLNQRIREMHLEAFPQPPPPSPPQPRSFADETEEEAEPSVPEFVAPKAASVPAPARTRQAPPARRTTSAARQAARPKPRASYYPSCAAARAAGAAPIRRGQAGYSARLDRDGDGIACE